MNGIFVIVVLLIVINVITADEYNFQNSTDDTIFNITEVGNARLNGVFKVGNDDINSLGYSWIGDINTGIYNVFEDQIGFGIGGNLRALIYDEGINVSSGKDFCITGGNCLSSVSGGGLWATNGTSIYNVTASKFGFGTNFPNFTMDIQDEYATLGLLSDDDSYIVMTAYGDDSYNYIKGGGNIYLGNLSDYSFGATATNWLHFNISGIGAEDKTLWINDIIMDGELIQSIGGNVLKFNYSELYDSDDGFSSNYSTINFEGDLFFKGDDGAFIGLANYGGICILDGTADLDNSEEFCLEYEEDGMFIYGSENITMGSDNFIVLNPNEDDANPTENYVEIQGEIRATNWTNITITQSQIIDLSVGGGLFETNGTHIYNATALGFGIGTDKINFTADIRGSYAGLGLYDTENGNYTIIRSHSGDTYFANSPNSKFIFSELVGYDPSLSPTNLLYIDKWGINATGRNITADYITASGYLSVLDDSFGVDDVGIYSTIDMEFENSLDAITINFNAEEGGINLTGKIKIGENPSELNLFGISQDKKLFIGTTQVQDGFSIEQTDNGALGSVIDLLHNSANPAIGDEVGRWRVLGRDSNGDYRVYGQMNVKIVDPTKDSSDGQFKFEVERGGGLARALDLNMGVATQMVVSDFPFGTDDRDAYFQSKRLTEGIGYNTILRGANATAGVSADYSGGNVYAFGGYGVGTETDGDVYLGYNPIDSVDVGNVRSYGDFFLNGDFLYNSDLIFSAETSSIGNAGGSFMEFFDDGNEEEILLLKDTFIEGKDLIGASISLDEDTIILEGETGDGWLYGNLEVDGNATSDYSFFKKEVTQFHRDTKIDTTSADTWVNITWDLTINEETTSGYTLTDLNQSIEIKEDGIYRVQGCLHPKNNGVGNLDASLYSRVLINNVEAKCLQYGNSKAFKTTEIDTMPFIGTIHVNAGEKVQVQYYVTNTDIDFEGASVFDDGVAGSVNFERISND